jgi:uncharacterized protein YvpB
MALCVLLWLLTVGASILWANDILPLAQGGRDGVVAGSPPTAATATWPVTWTPAPSPTPMLPAQTPTRPAFANLPAACHVETPSNLGRMRYPLDCEVTALWYLVQTHPHYRGLVNRDALYNALVHHENPDKGFRGDMRAARPGNSDSNYGLHARALVEVGQRAGIPLQVIRSVRDVKQRLCQGEPAIAWMRSAGGRQNPLLVRSYRDGDGVPYYTIAYEHAVLVTGYDPETVTYRDPSNGQLYAMTWQQFEQEIRLFGKQMVAAVASTPTPAPSFLAHPVGR